STGGMPVGPVPTFAPAAGTAFGIVVPAGITIAVPIGVPGIAAPDGATVYVDGCCAEAEAASPAPASNPAAHRFIVPPSTESPTSAKAYADPGNACQHPNLHFLSSDLCSTHRPNYNHSTTSRDSSRLTSGPRLASASVHF